MNTPLGSTQVAIRKTPTLRRLFLNGGNGIIMPGRLSPHPGSRDPEAPLRASQLAHRTIVSTPYFLILKLNRQAGMVAAALIGLFQVISNPPKV